MFPPLRWRASSNLGFAVLYGVLHALTVFVRLVRCDVFERAKGGEGGRVGVGDGRGCGGDRGGDVITETIVGLGWMSKGLALGCLTGADGFPLGTGEFGFGTGGCGLGTPFGELRGVGFFPGFGF